MRQMRTAKQRVIYKSGVSRIPIDMFEKAWKYLRVKGASVI